MTLTADNEMHKVLLITLSLSFCLSAQSNETVLSSFLLSFNGMSSNCDKVSMEQTFDNDGPVLMLTLHDLAELGNTPYKAGIPFEKLKIKSQLVVEGKRFAKFKGKKVKEVFRFEKDADGNLKQVSMKRYKRKLVSYSYPLGGIVCRYLPSEEN